MFSVNDLFEELCSEGLSEQERGLAWDFFGEIDERRTSEVEHMRWYLHNPNLSSTVKHALIDLVTKEEKEEEKKRTFLVDLIGDQDKYDDQVEALTNEIRNEHLRISLANLLLGIFVIGFLILLKFSINHSYLQGDSLMNLRLLPFFQYFIFAMVVVFFTIGLTELSRGERVKCEKTAKDKVNTIMTKKIQDYLNSIQMEEKEIQKINIVIKKYEVTNPSG